MAESSRIEELRRRVQLDPASIAFAALAEEYRRAGRCEEAVTVCRAGLQRHPAYLSARVTLGRALLELGLYEEARTELEHVLRLAPENLAAIRGLADIHSRHGRRPASGEPGPDDGTAPELPATAGEAVPAGTVAPVPASTPALVPIPISTVVPDESATAPEVSAAAPEVSAGAPDVLADPGPDHGAIPALETFLQSIERARIATGGERQLESRVSSDH